ncbi:hypothetical protein NXZ81_27150 [Klebsiella pneumoniae]|nr:hypothetical protein [Klebsiella pneumoniae]
MTMNLLIYKATAMMTPTFNARISGNNLIASLNDDTPIFSLNVSEDPSFWIEGGTLMVSLNTDSSHPVYRALDYKEAEQLLSVITLVLCNRKPKMKWKNTILPAAALLVTCFAVWRFAPAPLTGHATVRTGRTPECHRRIGSATFPGITAAAQPCAAEPLFWPQHNTECR